MADRNQWKIAARNDVADDDPFAELTRIMGFDPRQPVQKQTEPVLSHEDFEIDLEKELMGEFGLDAGHAPAVAAPAAALAPEPAATQSPSGHDMDAEIAASLADMDFDLATMDANIDEPAPEANFAPDNGEFHEFDDAFTRALNDEPAIEAAPSLDDRWPTDEEGGARAGDTLDTPMPSAATDDFDEHFDAAMADVDMDFDVRPEPVYEPVEPEASAPADEPAIAAFVEELEVAQAPEPADEPVFDDAFEADFHAALAEVPAEPEAVAEPLPPVEARQELSLEDELNALLGNMGAGIGKYGDSFVATPPRSPVVEAAPVAAAEAEVPRPEAATEADVHADLDAMLLDELKAEDFGDEIPFEPIAPEVAEAPAQAEPAPSRWPAALGLAASMPSRLWGRANPVAPPPAPEPVLMPVREEVAAEPTFERQQFQAVHDDPAPVAEEREVPAYQPAAAAFEQAPVAYEAAPPAYQPEAYQSAAYEQATTTYGHVSDAGESAPDAYAEEMPDIDTVDVPERVVALADDLDLPEVAFEEDEPVSDAYGDLEAEFSTLVDDLNGSEETVPAPRQANYDDEPYSAGFHDAYSTPHEPAPSYADAGQTAAQAATFAAAAYHGRQGFDASVSAPAGQRPAAPADSFAIDNLDYDPDLDETMASPGLSPSEMAPQPRRRGLMIAAVVGAVAIVGGIGAFALSPGGSGGTDAPVLVKADDAPIKVKPENPGGTVVPNQDNKVYEAVAKGAKPVAPAQKELVTAQDEPVDLAAREAQSSPVDLSPDEDGADAVAQTAKGEDRIDQAAQQSDAVNGEVAVVAPRKVRTMVVKPDGSLVPREDPTPAPMVAAAEPADPAPQSVVAAAPAEATAQTTGAVAAAAEPALKPAAKTQPTATPATVAAAPQRPAEQPVNIVGEVKPDQVASISPTEAAAGSWSMQIASQPSAEAAQSTYQDLARRYGSVLNGRGVNIVKAEIAGKGTFYRVRVPAQTRNEAISLCESYKAAGGNCFVSK